MLDSLRSFASSPIGILVFGAIIVGLLAFGVTAGGRVNVVARVGSQEIIAQDFQDEYQAALNNLARQQSITTEVRRQVGNEVLRSLMIPRALFDDHVDRLGLGLSDEGVAASIAANPDFRSGGSFSQTLLENYLRATGLSEREFVESQRESLLRNQVIQAIGPSGSPLPPAYENILADYFLERRTALYAVIGPETLGEAADEDPTEEEITAFFEDNAERWAAPELRTIDLLALTPERLADPATVTDEDLEAAYDARASDLGTPEQRTVFQQIFSDREEADAVAARLAEGATYDELVADGTIAPSSLGTLTRGALFDPAVADAAFAMEEGETEIIEGRSGATLVHVSEVIESDIPPLDEVAEQLRQDIAADRAAADISTLYLDIEDARAAGRTLPEIGDEFGLEIETLTIDQEGNDAEGDPIADLPGGNALVTNVFESDIGLADPALSLEGDSSYLWYEVTDVAPPRARSLDEVRDRVVAAWRDQAVDLRLQELSQTIVSRLRADAPIADIEAEFGVTFTESEPLGRGDDPPEGLPQSFVAALYGADIGFATSTANNATGERVILKATDGSIAPEDELDETAEQQIDTFRAQLNAALLNGYIGDLQARLGSISINETLVQQVIGVQ